VQLDCPRQARDLGPRPPGRGCVSVGASADEASEDIKQSLAAKSELSAKIA